MCEDSRCSGEILGVVKISWCFAHLCRRALSHKKVYIKQQAQEFDTPFSSYPAKCCNNNTSWRVRTRKIQMKIMWWMCKLEVKRMTVPPLFPHSYSIWSWFSQCSSFLRSVNLTMLRDSTMLSVLSQLSSLMHRRRTTLRDRTCVVCLQPIKFALLFVSLDFSAKVGDERAKTPLIFFAKFSLISHFCMKVYGSQKVILQS